MNRRIMFPLALIAVVIGAIFALLNFAFIKDDRPRSPRALSPVNVHDTTPGSRHGFGYGVVYTVAEKKIHDGKEYAVVKSHEKEVEIWSPLQQITSMPIGAKFHLIKGSNNFDEALQRITLKNR